MPLIIICGYPSSGKTTRSIELQTYLESNNHPVHIVSEQTLNLDKNVIYKNSQVEKSARGNIKAHIERFLNKQNTVIVDSTNYIKGFRYELYCAARSLNTTHCVVFCGVNKERIRQFNASRPPSDQYNNDVLEELLMRFEEPDSRNRWDKPLFLVTPDDSLPLVAIETALYDKKPAPPTYATIQPVVPDGNYLYDLDRITQSVANTVLLAQKSAVIGDWIPVPGSD
eukprot:Ihof_evm6s95 gene=Ihof_evmTU6s95